LNGIESGSVTMDNLFNSMCWGKGRGGEGFLGRSTNGKVRNLRVILVQVLDLSSGPLEKSVTREEEMSNSSISPPPSCCYLHHFSIRLQDEKPKLKRRQKKKKKKKQR